MSNGQNQIAALTGLPRQLGPSDSQLVPARLQTVTQAPMPLILIALPEKRTPYIDLAYISAPTIAIPGAPATAAPGVVALPVIMVNRYTGSDKTWQRLLELDVPVGVVFNLRELSLLSNNDSKTRYRIYLANIPQSIPTDRQTSTPLTLPFPDNAVPGGTSVAVDILSSDGTAITVDGELSGVLKTP